MREPDIPWTRQVATCTNVNHHVQVASTRPHTKDFPEDRRAALGLAVIRAREALQLSQRAFAARAKIGRTSLFKLETAEPVGAQVYEAAGRALPTWTEDTPRGILEGGRPPALSPGVSDLNPELDTAETRVPENTESHSRPAIGSPQWLIHYAGILPEQDYLEVRQVLLRMLVAEARALELEQALTERPLSQHR